MANSSPNSSLEIGSIIGDYKVTSTAASGSRSTIYRAEHTRFLRQVAIKVLHKAVTDSHARERLQVLLGRISQVRHANVAELYDFGFVEDQYPYLVLEWIEGYALDSSDAELMARPVEERFSFLQSIASAMDEVHLSELSLSGLDEGHVLVDSKRGRAKLIAYSLAEALAEGDDDTDTASGDEFDKAADYRRLGALIEQLFLGRDSKVDEPAAENIEVIVARCRTTEASDQFSSGKAITRDLKIALGLDAPKNNNLPVGTLVGESYKITGVLGKGGMGQVYEAVHVRLPQRVAIKVIDGTFTEEAYIRFRQEAEIAASLGHPHLVRVFDFNTFEDGRPYMVMELLEGEDLGRSMRYGPLSPKRAIEIARQVGSALTAVHKKGVVHRDLKPPNVFLGKMAIGDEIKEHATVLDFGVSKREDATISVTKTSAVVGTPQYMAPEQALGENDTLTAKADQFSLGCLLYEMLSGSPAFGRGTLAEVVYRVCQEQPPTLRTLFPDLPLSISEAVERAMSKRTQDRFDSVADFVAALSEDDVTDTARAPARSVETLRGPKPVSASAAAATVANGKSDVVSPDSATVANKRSDVVLPVSATVNAALPTDTVPPQDTPPPKSRPMRAIAASLIVLAGAGVFAFVMLSGGNKGEADEGYSYDQGLSDTMNSDLVKSSLALASDLDGAVKEALPLPDAGAVPTEDAGETLAVDLNPMDAGASPDAGSAVAVKPPRNPNRKPKNPKSPVVSKEITKKLDEAQKLIRSGRYREARRLISRDKVASSTARGRSLAVMSYCGEHNFGAAQDWLRRVPKSGRRSVIAYCKNKHQIELN